MRSKKLLMLLSVSLLLILNGLNAFAQNRIRVQGTVKDTKGETLVGAMVLVKGTQNGAMTDASGRYSLTGVASNATIVASSFSRTTTWSSRKRWQSVTVPSPRSPSPDLLLPPPARNWSRTPPSTSRKASRAVCPASS